MFYGALDTEALGGAGFASQRTSDDSKVWDLSSFDGIELEVDIAHSDDKQYTFILKDHTLKLNPETGRQQATISWEADFYAPQASQTNTANHVSVFLHWKLFAGRSCEV